jgi:hypothetical protein
MTTTDGNDRQVDRQNHNPVSRGWLKGLYEDGEGKTSTMRSLFILWAVVVLVVWVIVSFWTSKIQDIPTSVATILGTFAGTKAVQSFAEAWRRGRG